LIFLTSSSPEHGGATVVSGLTHPAINARWFGYRTGGYFFRHVDDDRYVAVLREPNATEVVDAIPFEPCEDPRRGIEKAATEWVRQRRLARRAG
jgi:hypothetical protein